MRGRQVVLGEEGFDFMNLLADVQEQIDVKDAIAASSTTSLERRRTPDTKIKRLKPALSANELKVAS